MKEISVKSTDGFKIDCLLFEVKKPQAVLLIVHGMQEHMYRYVEFAEFLNSRGINVCIGELRGHGKKTAKGNEGYVDGDIFQQILNDQIVLIKKLKKDYKLPIFLLGHSYGSFVTQRLLTMDLPVDKYVVMGSSFTNTPLMNTAKLIANLGCIVPGKRKKAKLIEKMSFGSYMQKFENGNWLSRDENVWKSYKEDEYCGVPFPYNFYRSMFNNLTANYKNIDNASKEKPILIISGTDDPVGDFGNSPRKLYAFYLKKRLFASLKLYEGARHEILNETNKDEVFQDIASFLIG